MASCTTWTQLSAGFVATPSATACFATATATVADEARRLSTGGSSEAPRSCGSTYEATASAAASSMPSVTCFAPETITPSPSPG